MCSSAAERHIPTSGCKPAVPTLLLPQPRLQGGACSTLPGHGASWSSQPERPSHWGPRWQPSYLSHCIYPNEGRQRATLTRPVVTSKPTCNQQQQQQQQQCALQPLPASSRAGAPGSPSPTSSCQQHLSTSATAKWAPRGMEIPEQAQQSLPRVRHLPASRTATSAPAEPQSGRGQSGSRSLSASPSCQPSSTRIQLHSNTRHHPQSSHIPGLLLHP